MMIFLCLTPFLHIIFSNLLTFHSGMWYPESSSLQKVPKLLFFDAVLQNLGTSGSAHRLTMSTELKELKIKTGVVKRTAKELSMYKKEADKERNALEKMKSETADEHDIRHQVRNSQAPLGPERLMSTCYPK